MNEKINIVNLADSTGSNINLSVSNFSGQSPSINLAGIKDLLMPSLEKIIFKHNEYAEINIGPSGGKIIGNIEAKNFIESGAQNSFPAGIYVNGIKFIPDYIIIDGISKTVLVAEE